MTWQAAAWLARVAVAFVALHAFGLPASLLDAVLVVVVTGLAGVIPFLPGGVGAQQAMLVYALRKTASAASVVTFGVGMQLGVTLLDLTVGVIALMITFRTLPCATPYGPAGPRSAHTRPVDSSASSSLIRPVTPSAVARSTSSRRLTGHVISTARAAQRIQAPAVQQPQVQRGAVERPGGRMRDQPIELPRRAAEPIRCASAGSISSSSGHARADTTTGALRSARRAPRTASGRPPGRCP